MSEFDNKASGWDENPVHAQRAEETFRAISRHVRLDRDFACLEYGSGTGLLSFAIRPYVKSITLCDTSEGMLKVAKEKIESGRVTNMKTSNLDLASGAKLAERFDLVYTLMALHHVPDTKKIVSVFFELLLPGGTLCIADLVEEDGSFHGNPEGMHMHHGFAIDRLSRMLSDAGFREIESEIYYSMERATENGIRKTYPIFLVVAKK
jgi:SAM-dependent methyltransferase